MIEAEQDVLRAIRTMADSGGKCDVPIALIADVAGRSDAETIANIRSLFERGEIFILRAPGSMVERVEIYTGPQQKGKK